MLVFGSISWNHLKAIKKQKRHESFVFQIGDFRLSFCVGVGEDAVGAAVSKLLWFKESFKQDEPPTSYK